MSWVCRTRGKQCCSVLLGAPELHCAPRDKMFREERDHLAAWSCLSPHCSAVYGEDLEDGRELSPSTLQSGPSPIVLPHVRVSKRSDVSPTLYKKWGSSRSCFLSFMNCWNRVLLQGDLQTSGTVAKMHRTCWEFCRELNTWTFNGSLLSAFCAG